MLPSFPRHLFPSSSLRHGLDGKMWFETMGFNNSGLGRIWVPDVVMRNTGDDESVDGVW